jgi:hypothetical protein
MALMHIMPEAANTYAGYAECNDYGENPFPLPYVLIMAGYLLILIIDRWLAASFHLTDEDEVLQEAPQSTAVVDLRKGA